MPNKKIPSSKMWNEVNNFLIKTNQILELEKYYFFILNEIKKLIPYNAAHIVIHKNIENQFIDLLTINIPPKTVNNYLEYYQFIDNLKANNFNQFYPVKSTQIIDYKQWQKTEYFTDFLQANNYHYLCGIDIHYQEKLLITITLIRDKTSPDFKEQELLYLELLRPHIANHIYPLLIIEQDDKFKPNIIIQKINNNLRKYKLSKREAEVTKLVIQGLNNQQIAQELFISINTVKKHLYKIFIKINVNNKRELISKLLEI